MLPGFLRFVIPSRATFMFDFVVVAMVLILPVLTYSIYLVKVKRNYRLHKTLQVLLGLVLLLAVTLFEIDVRMYGWRHLAEASPYAKTILPPVLAVHLFFAISTTVLWIVTIARALVKFPSPVAPNSYSPTHKRLAWIAALGMYATSVTGWTFYYLAFVAR